MKNIWKWLFFILLAIVLVAIAIFVMNFSAMAQYHGTYGSTMMSPFGGRAFGYHDFDGMRGGFTYGFSLTTLPFMLFGFLFRFLPLIVFSLIIWGIYRLGVSSGRSQSATPETGPKPVEPKVEAKSSDEGSDVVEIKE